MQRLKDSLMWWTGGLLVLLFSWSLLRGDFFLTHDFTHIARIAEMRLALEGGHFPAIWSQNLGFGYGMPLFLFYGPLPFYLGVILSYFGLSFVTVTKLLFLLSSILAFGGMYALLQRWGRAAALAGAMLLLAAPYRAVDIYIRGALNEVLAIGILPWILHSAFAVKEEKRWAVPSLAFWTAALILTHNLTALVALPLIGLFSLLWIALRPAKRWLRQVLQLILGFLWGGALSVFYLLPAFLEKQYTAIESILGGYFDFRLHFLYIRQLLLARWGYGGSEYGPNDGISFHLTWLTLFLSLGAIGVFAWRWWLLHQEERTPSLLQRLHLIHTRLPSRAWLIPLSAGFFALTLFFTLGHSQMLWETLPLVSYLQFPWRFLGVAIVFGSLLIGLGLSLLKPFWLRWGMVGATLFLAIWLVRFHRPESFYSASDGHFSASPVLIREQISSILPDYIPKDFYQKLPPVETERRIEVSQGEVIWEMNEAHQLLATIQPTGPLLITWNIADFPGWRYYVNHEEVQPVLLDDGRRQLQSTSSVESVGAQFTPTPVRQWTLGISALAWLFWLSIVLWRHRAQS